MRSSHVAIQFPRFRFRVEAAPSLAARLTFALDDKR